MKSIKIGRTIKVYKPKGGECVQCFKRDINFLILCNAPGSWYEVKLCFDCINESFLLIDSNSSIRSCNGCIICQMGLEGTRQVFQHPSKKNIICHMKCYKWYLEKVNKNEQYKKLRITESL